MFRHCFLFIFLLTIALKKGTSSDILFFYQDCNVDIPSSADSTCRDERYNLYQTVIDLGHNITLLPDFHQADMSSLLSSSDFFMIPDIEDNFTNCNVNNPLFINADEKDMLKSYVENGGNILITGSKQNVDFLNGIFNLGLKSEDNTSSGLSTKNIAQSEGTTFQHCPDTLPNLDVTFLVSSTMPSNKRCLYEFGTFATAAYFEIGNGAISYLGFDFNDAGPSCSQNGSLWVSCLLESSIMSATTGIHLSSAVTVPTLTTWCIIILGLLLINLGMIGIKSTIIL